MLQRGGPLPAILILPTSSTIGEGNGNPLQYSWLGNPMDRGAWQATVHGAAESDTTEHTFLQLQKDLQIIILQKVMNDNQT